MSKLKDHDLVTLRIQHSNNADAASETINRLLNHIDAVTHERNEAQTEVENVKANGKASTVNVIEKEKQKEKDKAESLETRLDTLSTMPIDEPLPAYVPPVITDGSDPESSAQRNEEARLKAKQEAEAKVVSGTIDGQIGSAGE